MRRALAVVVLALGLGAGIGLASETDEVPDAQLLLDLDLLTQAQPHERDLIRSMSVVERMRMLELYRLLDVRTPAPRRSAPPPADPTKP